jgi:hypothetical protein
MPSRPASCHSVVGASVAGLVHDNHAALAQFGKDLVAAEPGPGVRQRSSRRSKCRFAVGRFPLGLPFDGGGHLRPGQQVKLPQHGDLSLGLGQQVRTVAA